ncbi:transaldolase family protein [Kitasatospora sp. NPDC056651]|uniref:transaldolase family protein n=1 Tax=Kitasatospora sp. NPDC056651 TaxID=3345892 RepID=UPI0036AE6F98
MISRLAIAMLHQLAAEGVAPWLSADATSDFDVEVLSHLARRELVAGVVLTGGPPAVLHRVCDALFPAFLATDGRAGHVSVAPDVGHGASAEGLFEAAGDLHEQVGRANVLVRLPVDPGGVTAMRDCLAEGIGVHAGPVYSEEGYEQLLDAFFVGIERALVSGLPLHEITLVAGVPVGRLDDAVDARLAAVPGPRAVAARGTAAVALARCLHRLREDRLSTDWWRVIRTAGAQLPLLLWSDPSPRHMESLVGANTAHVLSVRRLEAVAAETELAGEALMGSTAEGRRVLKELAELGVDLESVVRDLERAGQGCG